MLSKRKQVYLQYLNSDSWKMKRAIYLTPNASCAICGFTKRLQLHHKTYANLGEETAKDFIILCKRCHNKIHFTKRAKRNFAHVGGAYQKEYARKSNKRRRSRFHKDQIFQEQQAIYNDLKMDYEFRQACGI